MKKKQLEKLIKHIYDYIPESELSLTSKHRLIEALNEAYQLGREEIISYYNKLLKDEIKEMKRMNKEDAKQVDK